MQVDSCGFPKGRDEGCPEESACRNGPAAILSVSTGCDPGEGPSSEMGTALGRQGPNNGRARVAGPPRKKPRGRSPVPQFDAQACPNTNRCPPAFGMAERRESLRGKAWHSAQPTLSLIHISEPTRLGMISYAVFCLKKKKKKQKE